MFVLVFVIVLRGHLELEGVFIKGGVNYITGGTYFTVFLYANYKLHLLKNFMRYKFVKDLSWIALTIPQVVLTHN